MNLFQRAYALGAQESAARFKLADVAAFKPVAAPTPKPAPAPSGTASGSTTAAKMPAPVGATPAPMAGAIKMPTLPQLPAPIPNPVQALAGVAQTNMATNALDHTNKIFNPLARAV